MTQVWPHAYFPVGKLRLLNDSFTKQNSIFGHWIHLYYFNKWYSTECFSAIRFSNELHACKPKLTTQIPHENDLPSRMCFWKQPMQSCIKTFLRVNSFVKWNSSIKTDAHLQIVQILSISHPVKLKETLSSLSYQN